MSLDSRNNFSYRRVFAFLKGHTRWVLIVTILFILQVPLRLYEPQLAQRITDLSLTNSDMSLLYQLCLAYLAIILIRAVLNGWGEFAANTLRLKVWQSIRISLYDKLLRLRMSVFDAESPGYLISRQVDDAENIDGLMYDFVLNTIIAVIESAVILVLIFRLSALLSTVTLLMLSLTFVVQYMFPLRKLYKDHSEAKATLTRELHETIAGIPLIKATMAYLHQCSRYARQLEHYVLKRKKRDQANIIRGNLTRVLSNTAYPAVIIIGSLLVMKHTLTIGQLIAFTLYQRRLFANTTPLINAYPLFSYARAGFERIFEFLDLPQEDCHDITDTSQQPVLSGHIEFRNVSFRYGGAEVLHNLSFVIPQGKTTAIVGASGSGKSTIVKLLLRFYEPQAGQIIVDGRPLNEIPLAVLRRSISYVPQEPYIFNESIAYNIGYSQSSVALAEIAAAAKLAGCCEFINQLEQRYDSIVGDRGLNLSGGQRQRICIAREVLRDAPIMIFDEATSALDSISESAIQEAMARLSQNKTTIIIAHRLSTIQNADQILVLDSGRAVERGTHDELLRAKGHYYNLYRTQTEGRQTGELMSNETKAKAGVHN